MNGGGVASAFTRKILYAVTDRLRLGLDEPALVERVGWLARAGVDLIQIRERDLTDAALVALARRAVAAAGDRARVLVNDRADIAIAAGAHGVQLRGDACAASRVRAAAPAGFVIGRSVHSLGEASAAASGGGCDFLLFGTIFRSRGKPAAHPEAGLDALGSVCRAVALPVVAIGGIDAASAAPVAAAGAAGIAGVDAFFGVRDEREARARVAELRRAFDSGSEVV